MIEVFSTSLIFVCLISLFIGVILLIYNTSSNSNNKLLAFFYILTAYQCFITLLLSTEWIKGYPHFYRTGYIALLIAAPISYLYIRNSIKDQAISNIDFLHFLPAIIYVLDYSPFFLLPGADKIELLAVDNINRSYIQYKESILFPSGFYTSFRYFQALVYWILQVALAFIYLRKDINNYKKNKVWFGWLLIFILTQAFLFTPPFALLNAENEYNPWIIFFYVGGGTALTSILILLFPKTLYGVKFRPDETSPVHSFHTNQKRLLSDDRNQLTSVKMNSEHLKETAYLSNDRMEQISKEIEMFFKSNPEPYLRIKYSINDLSTDLEISAQYLSRTLNEYNNISFNDFVNQYRITYCLNLFDQGLQEIHTLESLSKMCGFNNRNSFTQAFKKITRKTPSIFIKNMNKNDESNSAL